MINIKGSRDYLVALESVAMTDIVLNMFIFFFISFSLIYTFSQTKVSKINISMPKASSAVALEGSEKIILTVTEKGEYFVDDHKVSAGDLKREVLEKLTANKDAGMLLKVDDQVKFDSVAKALDIVHELDVGKVGVAAIKSQGGDDR